MAVSTERVAAGEVRSINPATLEVVGSVPATAPDVTRPKLVDADGGRLRAPWWYPYAGDGPAAFRGLLETLYSEGAGARARAMWRHWRDLVRLARRYRS